MAKTQTFADKLKKGKVELTNVKVIQGYRSESGAVKFMEQFVKVADPSEIAKIDLRS